MDYLSSLSDTQQSLTLTDTLTESLSNPCARLAMFQIFLAILKFCTIQRLTFEPNLPSTV